ncbi:MAG: hypothetical protein IJA86_03450 [Clostridia bacterium]|nr:hypothetical protein [Clostridia bacterium]
MKKIISIVFFILLSFSLFGFSVFGESESNDVYVSISDESGALVLAYAPVSLIDEDGDGNLTVNDALIAAHKAHYKNGAEGFASEETPYGCSITKLWGFAGGSGYGYCVNDSSAMSCYDPVQVGDHIKAFIYTDTESFSDVYCFFDQTSVSAKINDTVILTLYANTYDENWNTVKLPLAGAEILVNGKDSGIVTDANGKAEISVKMWGDITVSAKSDSKVLVAPVCIVCVDAGEMLLAMTVLTIAVIAAIAAAVVIIMKKRRNHA